MTARIRTFFPVICLAGALPAAGADGVLNFNRDIRPILSENCFACHGFDAKKREADLRLDTAKGAFAKQGDVTPIVPGNLEKSEVWRRIIATDPNDLMPPEKSHKKLSAAQKDILRHWIEQGAAYERHWSLETPRLPEIPKIAGSAIDAFLEERLTREKLAIQPEADRATQIRRVSFTLTGLPPTPEEVAAFENDRSPTAYEAMVDRYLKSPRFGEEMARHWLDVARYGDTHGLHLDNERHMWAYRDWVVRAFNENLPFDRFTTWQLAGDLLPEPTNDQLTATGFIRSNVTTSEGGAIDEEYRHLYAIDRAATTTVAWLGVTGGCAQCHDHKYDPLSMRDFYSLYAFFYSAADPAMDGNIAKTLPILKLPGAGQQEALEATRRYEAARLAALDALPVPAYAEPGADAPPRQVTQLIFDDDFPPGTEQRNTSRNAPQWLDRPKFGVKSGRRVLIQRNGQFFEHAITPALIPVTVPEKNGRFEIWVRPDPLSPPRTISIVIGGRRVFWGEDEALTVYNAGTMSKVTRLGPLPKLGQWTRLTFGPEVFDLAPGARVATVSVQQIGGLVAWDRFTLTGELSPAKDPLASFVLWWRQSGGKKPKDMPESIATTFATAPDKVTEAAAKEKLLAFYLRRVAWPVNDSIARARMDWEAQRVAAAAADEAIPTTFVFGDLPEPRETFIAMRGQYNKPGEKVEPAIPVAFGAFRAPSQPRRLDRLDLAKWLVAPEHPLTARVTVNRFWQQVFGVGLVKTSHDFGSQGEPPSHPDLLDWLAVNFQQTGWDVKRLVKEMVMTRAFRRSFGPQSIATDPENRLLIRAPRIRLDAEQIRDNALFVGGLINLDMGGRGVFTYQPPNIWEPVGYGDSNTRYYVQDHGAALYRRSLYCFIKRTAPPPFMSNFDAPNREQICVRRERNNTPMQALQLLNDTQHFEAARALAERALAEGGKDDTTRLRWLFRTVLSRYPDETEARMLTAELSKQRGSAKADPAAAEKAIRVGESPPKLAAPAAELAAWTLMANLVLNLDETVTRN
jgi:hypothetical protein